MDLSANTIVNYLDKLDIHINNSQKIQFEHSVDWANRNFNNQPAIYAFFDNDILTYIGETSSLLKRMKDIRRTYNHTFRKKIGRKLFNNNVSSKGVFSLAQELEITTYFEDNITITFHYINFGRLEAESYLVHKNQKNPNAALINKIGRRDETVIKYLTGND